MSNEKRTSFDELVRRCQTDDKEAFTLIYNRYLSQIMKETKKYKYFIQNNHISFDDIKAVVIYSLYRAVMLCNIGTKSFSSFWQSITYHEVMRYVKENRYYDVNVPITVVLSDSIPNTDLSYESLASEEDTKMDYWVTLSEIIAAVKNPTVGLTKDEQLVMKYIIEGYDDNAVIAKCINKSSRSVCRYRTNAVKKIRDFFGEFKGDVQ